MYVKRSAAKVAWHVIHKEVVVLVTDTKPQAVKFMLQMQKKYGSMLK